MKNTATSPLPKPEKPKVDWEAVENDYRAGILSLRAIGETRGCSAGRIAQVAKERGWSRDLTAKIQAEAEAKLNKDALNAELNTKQRLDERVIIESNAEAIANVVRGHRKDLGELRGVVTLLIEEVKTIFTNRELFEQVGELCLSPDSYGIDKINALYKKVIDLPTQTDVVKRLAETLKLLIELERKVFKIDALEDPHSAVEAAAKGAAAGAAMSSETTRAVLEELLGEM